MELFSGLTIIAVAVLVYFFYTNPTHWHSYVRWIPATAFMVCARFYDMSMEAWQNAFIFAGFCALFILIVQIRQKIIFDRIMLGMNLFFMVGAYGFLSDNEALLEWYAASKGGPLFGCIVFVGLFATIFTCHGFIGVTHKKRQAVQYASLLLFAAAIIALYWSVRTDEQGLLISVIIPFVGLRVIRDQLVRQMD